MVAIQKIPEKILRAGLRRQAVIRPLAQALSLTKGQIKDAALELGLSRARVYDLIRNYRKSPCVETLLHWKWSCGDRWHSRLDARTEEITQDCISRYYLGVKEPIRIAALHAVIEQACLQAGARVPSEQTVRRRIKRLPARTLAMSGKLRGPSDKRDHHPQHHVVERYLEEVQIDHTMVDAMIDLRSQGLGVYRPWVTLAIDVATRLIYGYYIGLRPPTHQNTCAVLLQGTANKSDWLRRRGFDYSQFRSKDVPDLWPSSQGLPETVFTDRGKDFDCRTTQLGCSSIGIQIRYRPAGATYYGGHIERLIGNFMTHHKMLPGMTGSNVVDRADYESTKHALLTLKEYEQWLLLEILQYHSATNSRLGCTPIQQFNDLCPGIQAQSLRSLDAWRIRYAFLERVSRKVRPSGITLGGRTYSHPKLAELDGKTVCIFYDRTDNRHASLSLDGKNEHLGLALQADGKPVGHQDIYDLKFKDPRRIEETKKLNGLSREIIAEQMEMMRRLKLRKPSQQPIPKVVYDDGKESNHPEKASNLGADLNCVGTFGLREPLI